jgi:Ca2+/H+ antiporter
MIALNGIVGLSLVLGGARHLEQGFAARGASAFLTVVITIAVLCLVLPNYTTTMPGPYFSTRQLIFVAVMALITYGVFLFVMTVRHRDDFLHGHGVGNGVHSRATPLLRNHHSHQAHLTELFDNLGGESALTVDFGGLGCDLSAGKLPHLLDQHLLGLIYFRPSVNHDFSP